MLAVIKLIRYRFLLFAGMFPYILGQVVAFHFTNRFNLFYFIVGFIGLVFVLIGIETFNEYFDAKLGTDRVFALEPEEKVSDYILKIGILAFSLAFIVALYLTWARGWPVIYFALLGFLAAAFYVAPPFKWIYRGGGELVIFLAYGPFMTLGSYYLQSRRIDFNPILASLLVGFLILALALVNEIPDYFGDRLVGKRNLVVRLGRKKTVALYQILLLSCFALLSLGLIFGWLPLFSLTIYLTLPLALRNISLAKRYYDQPLSFIPVIRGTIFLYVAVVAILIISYLIASA